jgi:hypothetical protein
MKRDLMTTAKNSLNTRSVHRGRHREREMGSAINTRHSSPSGTGGSSSRVYLINDRDRHHDGLPSPAVHNTNVHVSHGGDPIVPMSVPVPVPVPVSVFVCTPQQILAR